MSEQAPRNWLRILLKVCFVVAAGCLVIALAALLAWHQCRWSWGVDREQNDTAQSALYIQGAIEEYTRANGAAPESLEPIRVLLSDLRSAITVNKSGAIVDGWGRPLHYAVIDGKGVATSYGRDGQPGGVGLDYDISSQEPWPVGAYVTLRQYTFESRRPGLSHALLLVGAFAGIACFGVLRRQKKVLLVIPIGLVLGFHEVYQPINRLWTVERFGCGCPPMTGSPGFNANHFNLILWTCLGAASVALWCWLIGRLFKHRSPEWRRGIRIAGTCVLLLIALKCWAAGCWL
jgi:hypothetical protein